MGRASSPLPVVAAAAAAALLLLVATVGAQTTVGDDGKTTYTGRAREANTLVMGGQLIVEAGTRAFANITRDFLAGKLQLGPARERNVPRKEITVDCLNSVAPPPLNWKMWCPGKDAKVVGWVDANGAAHREVLLRPQKNMTATMAMWFLSSYVMGLMPPVVEFQGKHYYYYHLWHPLDHVEAASKMGPSLAEGNIAGVGFYTLIHERYRNPASFKRDRHFETNNWFAVVDPVGNLAKNRVVLGINLLGLEAWTLRAQFLDSAEGMVVQLEVEVGVGGKGSDPLDPLSGNAAAGTLNDLMLGGVMGSQLQSPDYDDAFDAMVRHMVEEFSNLQFFVPELYARTAPLGKANVTRIPTLGAFLSSLNKTRADGPTLSLYNQLAGAASKLRLSNVTGTKAGAAALQAVQGLNASLASNPQSAFNGSATPPSKVQAPLYKAMAEALDGLKASSSG